MTCDLMTHLFSNKEIANSSRTGKKGKGRPDIANNKKKPLMADNRFIAMKGLYLSIFFPIHKKCIQRFLT